ncbi:MAG: hypothetical protein B6230_02655, partial [Desulfobacteraceae bacterium 4572_89]
WLSYKQKTPEAAPDNVYIKLQQHLDSQAVGFPATKGQSEIRILKHIFTPEQAEIATCLTHRPENIETRPPETRQELYEILLAGKKDPMDQVKLFGRLAKDMIRTGDLGLIKKNQPPTNF